MILLFVWTTNHPRTDKRPNNSCNIIDCTFTPEFTDYM